MVTLAHRCRPRLLTATALAAIALTLPGAGAATYHADGASAVFEDQLSAAGIPGGAFVTVTDEGVVRAHPVGTTGDGEPVTDGTPFVIGSTTKSFTALAVMQLAEGGAVDLDAPVTRYVPGFLLADGEPTDAITVRHLLQHTSGLDDLQGGPVLSGGQSGTALDAVDELGGARLAFEPGDSWRYANADYVLLGLVIEEASGQPYPDYLAEHVFAPLGLTDTHVRTDPAVAPGHRYWFGLTAASGPVQPQAVAAAGFIASSAQDLGDYLAMYLRDGTAADGTQLLSPAGIRTLTTPGPEAHLGPWAEGATARYAMGWMVGGPWREQAVFHPGNAPDSSSMIALFPDRGLAAATLVPAGNEIPLPGNLSLTDHISRNTLHAVLGEAAPAPTSPWDFYLWFDALVLVLLATGSWRLARAARSLRRPTPGVARGLVAALPAVVTAAALMTLPTMTAYGWSGLWTWAPDLTLVVLALTALAAATGALRLVAAVRRQPPGMERPRQVAAQRQPHDPIDPMPRRDHVHPR